MVIFDDLRRNIFSHNYFPYRFEPSKFDPPKLRTFKALHVNLHVNVLFLCSSGLCAIDMDNDGNVEWKEFALYLKWAGLLTIVKFLGDKPPTVAKVL